MTHVWNSLHRIKGGGNASLLFRNENFHSGTEHLTGSFIHPIFSRRDNNKRIHNNQSIAHSCPSVFVRSVMQVSGWLESVRPNQRQLFPMHRQHNSHRQQQKAQRIGWKMRRWKKKKRHRAADGCHNNNKAVTKRGQISAQKNRYPKREKGAGAWRYRRYIILVN